MLEEIWRRIYFSNLAVLLKQILVHTNLSIAVESVSSLYKCSPKQGIYFNLLRRTRNNVGHIAKISDILHKSSWFWINSWSKNEIYIIYIWYPRSLLKKRYIYLLFKLPENQPHLFACQTDFFLSQMAWLHNCMGLFFLLKCLKSTWIINYIHLPHCVNKLRCMLAFCIMQAYTLHAICSSPGPMLHRHYC